jgi:hypothetical protein
VAGRHADDTYDTFNWFKAQAPIVTTTLAEGNCSAEYWEGSDGYLNFAFTGTLTINCNAYPMALGQFGSDSGNEWVFGGPGWQGPECSSSFATPDGKFALVSRTSGSGTNYSITIDAL